MFKKEDGFTLIELLIAMFIFGIVMLLTGNTFQTILKLTSQQTKIAETQIEGIVGLEILRTDIEQAGYGLPWAFPQGVTINYQEAAVEPCTGITTNDSTGGVPRAILSCNNTGVNTSDYLVIKSTITARNDASQRWTYITSGASPNAWTAENLVNNNRVIVIKPKTETTLRQLIMDGATFFTNYSSTNFSSNFSPTQTGEVFLIYGVDDDTDLRMPFNRADYYISTSSPPSDCAKPTTKVGVLTKGVVSHGSGAIGFGANSLPLLDCVADFQVVFGRDTDENGIRDVTSDDITGLTAQQIREQVKDVTISILTHEGKKDSSYTYSNNTITVGPHIFDLTAITDWQRYRWKVHTMVIRPKNLT